MLGYHNGLLKDHSTDIAPPEDFRDFISGDIIKSSAEQYSELISNGIGETPFDITYSAVCEAKETIKQEVNDYSSIQVLPIFETIRGKSESVETIIYDEAPYMQKGLNYTSGGILV
jgi:hypothetical protein